MKDEYTIQIDSIVKQDWKQPVIIAGHYCLSDTLSELSNSGESEYNTFLFGVLLTKKLLLMGNKPSLVLFVNDIGIDPIDRADIKTNYNIPDNYKHLLARIQFRSATAGVCLV
jgi:hypothetical protein